MGALELLLLSIALSMDAFAVAICKGLSMRKIDWKHALIIALFFGGFQALMPFLGWAMGIGLEGLISAYDHWIAFLFLACIGGKFIYDALHAGGEACDDSGIDLKALFLLAIATSVDALAVGLTFALLKVDIGRACCLIGVVTFVISLGGVVVGNFFGSRYQKKAQVAGGALLILIGTKILLEHMAVL